MTNNNELNPEEIDLIMAELGSGNMKNLFNNDTNGTPDNDKAAKAPPSLKQTLIEKITSFTATQQDIWLTGIQSSVPSRADNGHPTAEQIAGSIIELINNSTRNEQVKLLNELELDIGTYLPPLKISQPPKI